MGDAFTESRDRLRKLREQLQNLEERSNENEERWRRTGLNDSAAEDVRSPAVNGLAERKEIYREAITKEIDQSRSPRQRLQEGARKVVSQRRQFKESEGRLQSLRDEIRQLASQADEVEEKLSRRSPSPTRLDPGVDQIVRERRASLDKLEESPPQSATYRYVMDKMTVDNTRLISLLNKAESIVQNGITSLKQGQEAFIETPLLELTRERDIVIRGADRYNKQLEVILSSADLNQREVDVLERVTRERNELARKLDDILYELRKLKEVKDRRNTAPASRNEGRATSPPRTASPEPKPMIPDGRLQMQPISPALQARPVENKVVDMPEIEMKNHRRLILGTTAPSQPKTSLLEDYDQLMRRGGPVKGAEGRVYYSVDASGRPNANGRISSADWIQGNYAVDHGDGILQKGIPYRGEEQRGGGSTMATEPVKTGTYEDIPDYQKLMNRRKSMDLLRDSTDRPPSEKLPRDNYMRSTQDLVLNRHGVHEAPFQELRGGHFDVHHERPELVLGRTNLVSVEKPVESTRQHLILGRDNARPVQMVPDVPQAKLERRRSLVLDEPLKPVQSPPEEEASGDFEVRLPAGMACSGVWPRPGSAPTGEIGAWVPSHYFDNRKFENKLQQFAPKDISSEIQRLNVARVKKEETINKVPFLKRTPANIRKWVSEEKRQHDARVQQMMKGNIMSKVAYGTGLFKNSNKGNVSPRLFRISTDLREFQWADPQKKKFKSLPIADIMRLTHGQRSPSFVKKAIYTEDDWLSFSVHFPTRTVDIVANDKDQILVWFLGLQALMTHRTHHTEHPHDYITEGRLFWRLAVLRLHQKALVEKRNIGDILLYFLGINQFVARSTRREFQKYIGDTRERALTPPAPEHRAPSPSVQQRQPVLAPAPAAPFSPDQMDRSNRWGNNAPLSVRHDPKENDRDAGTLSLSRVSNNGRNSDRVQEYLDTVDYRTMKPAADASARKAVDDEYHRWQLEEERRLQNEAAVRAERERYEIEREKLEREREALRIEMERDRERAARLDAFDKVRARMNLDHPVGETRLDLRPLADNRSKALEPRLGAGGYPLLSLDDFRGGGRSPIQRKIYP